MAERGLTRGGAQVQPASREFLAGFEQAGVVDLSGLSAAAVTDYVVAECARVLPARRSGWSPPAVAAEVPVPGRPYRPSAGLGGADVANWGAGSLPRGISPEAVAALCASCDGGTVIGLRDRAILVLLARLGLRGGSGALELGDLDWRRQSIRAG